MGMKLGKSVLIEIVAIVQKGLLEGVDISEQLRQIEVEVDSEETDRVRLTDEYVERRKSEKEWE